MTINELRYALQGLSFLDSLSARPERAVEIARAPAPHLLLWGADDLAEVFRHDADMRPGVSDTLRPFVGPTSLLFATGARHTAYRAAIGPVLRGKRLNGHVPAIRSIVADAADQLAVGGSFVVPRWARRVTLRVIGHILFRDENSPLLTRTADLVDRALGTRWRTLCYRHVRLPAAVPSPWRTFLRERDMLREDLFRTRPGTGATGCLPLGGELARGHPLLGPVGQDELADQLISLIFAGHETTASAISWTLYWIARHDRIRTDLKEELAATTSDGSSATALPLLDAVCRETLRLTPPATVAGNRILTSARQFPGRSMTRSTILTPCIYLAHRQPDVYPHPDRFDPGRFTDGKWSGQYYLPFGGGTRRCLGADLAMLELRMAIAAVLRRVELGRPARNAGVPRRRGPAMGPSPTLTLATRPCT